jgi:hypothetical protein
MKAPNDQSGELPGSAPDSAMATHRTEQLALSSAFMGKIVF